MRRNRCNDIAMIFKKPMTSLNPLYKIGNQMVEAIRMHKRKKKRQEARHEEIEMMELVGLPRDADLFNAYPHQWSGGMRQRVMIAMAMSSQPDLLIADEPTTALDVTIQAQVLQLMKKLHTEENTSLLLITHDLGVVSEL